MTGSTDSSRGRLLLPFDRGKAVVLVGLAIVVGGLASWGCVLLLDTFGIEALGVALAVGAASAVIVGADFFLVGLMGGSFEADQSGITIRLPLRATIAVPWDAIDGFAAATYQRTAGLSGGIVLLSEGETPSAAEARMRAHRYIYRREAEELDRLGGAYAGVAIVLRTRWTGPLPPSMLLLGSNRTVMRFNPFLARRSAWELIRALRELQPAPPDPASTLP